ncbi:hypothetical protein [Jannaschia formosa]|uniref:hypothetical protein n=1 Tax=Jannaschia formosa TaxID=2259592 RepID=UPI001FD7D6A0|nr:hypothetical protein [Jannaschia formosa]
MGKVLQHPRCLNCHPVEGGPLQGDAMVPHQPPVMRGDAGFGAVGMRCSTCHGNPGESRNPAPGSQDLFRRLTQTWIDAGAHCPA